MSLLKVFYKCSCMQDEGSFQMQERGPRESIQVFMVRLTEQLSIDHRMRNAACRAVKVEYVKIPVAADKNVGQS